MSEKRSFWQALLKIISTSCLIALVVSVIGIIYGFFAAGRFTFNYALIACLGVGAFIVALGVIMYALPARVANKKLVDHSNYAQEIMAAREIKRVKAYDNIYVGIGVILVAAFAEYLLFVIF